MSVGSAPLVQIEMTPTAREAERLMAETVARYGRIDVLANVVGGTIWWQPYGEYTEEQILLELERSLHTTLWCCRAVLPGRQPARADASRCSGA